jgi:hypothetical protein
VSNELDRSEDGHDPQQESGAAVVLVVIPVLAIAAFVAVASIAQAVREKSWSLIWSIGWLLAVLVASLWTPTRQTLLAAAAWLDRPLAARPTS